jgi:hypothetical protein
MTRMDFSLLVMAALFANGLTLAFLWNVRQLFKPDPPIWNILGVLLTAVAVILVALAASQSLTAGL